MGATSETRTWDALLSTTLSNVKGVLHDNITSRNALFYMLKKSDNWKTTDSLGDRCQFPLMYEQGTADVYSGYDALDTTPTEGVTSAFFEWRQMAVPITISRREERLNAGSEVRILDLLKAKTKQAMMGIEELFGKAVLQGNGPNSATAIQTPFTSANTGAQFIDPLPRLVAYDPTASLVVGAINQSTETWWRNQFVADDSTTYAGFLKKLRTAYNLASEGVGDGPDIHITDRLGYELYEAALAASHRNTSYAKADIPFDNIVFRGSAVVWDKYVPDAANGTVAGIPVSASSTWYMLNSKFLEMKTDSKTDFITTDFVKPENQDAKTAHILWLGSLGVTNRRKHCVVGSIDNTIVS